MGSEPDFDWMTAQDRYLAKIKALQSQTGELVQEYDSVIRRLGAEKARADRLEKALVDATTPLRVEEIPNGHRDLWSAIEWRMKELATKDAEIAALRQRVEGAKRILAHETREDCCTRQPLDGPVYCEKCQAMNALDGEP